MDSVECLYNFIKTNFKGDNYCVNNYERYQNQIKWQEWLDTNITPSDIVNYCIEVLSAQESSAMTEIGKILGTFHEKIGGFVGQYIRSGNSSDITYYLNHFDLRMVCVDTYDETPFYGHVYTQSFYSRQQILEIFKALEVTVMILKKDVADKEPDLPKKLCMIGVDQISKKLYKAEYTMTDFPVMLEYINSNFINKVDNIQVWFDQKKSCPYTILNRFEMYKILTVYHMIDFHPMIIGMFKERYSEYLMNSAVYYCYDYIGVKSILHYLYEVIAGNNEEMFCYLLRWLAHTIQGKPTRSKVMLVLHGHQGGGKTTFNTILRELIGAKHFLTITNTQLTQKFKPEGFADAFCVAVEEYNGKDYAMDSNKEYLKSIITDDVLNVEQKHKNSKSEKVHFSLIATTNNTAQLFPDDEGFMRRLCVLQVKAPEDSFAYYENLFKTTGLDEQELMFKNERRLITFALFADFLFSLPEPTKEYSHLAAPAYIGPIQEFPMTKHQVDVFIQCLKPLNRWILYILRTKTVVLKAKLELLKKQSWDSNKMNVFPGVHVWQESIREFVPEDISELKHAREEQLLGMILDDAYEQFVEYTSKLNNSSKPLSKSHFESLLRNVYHCKITHSYYYSKRADYLLFPKYSSLCQTFLNRFVGRCRQEDALLFGFSIGEPMEVQE